MTYKDLEIWVLADELVIEIHRMTLLDLPKFEMFETGNQIRRSMKSVKSNIAEGFGRRGYKKEFLHFLNISLGSNIETIDHLETLFKTGSLSDQGKYLELQQKLNILGRKLRRFIDAVNKNHKT